MKPRPGGRRPTARKHVDSLRRQVNEFRKSAPYSLTPEPTQKPGRLAYRLRLLKPVPVAISTTIGDVLSNLRAALESLAFEMARRTQGGSLSARQEAASTFPICETPQAFDDFFNKHGMVRRSLYDARAQAAFRSVQPFTNLEEAQKMGAARDRSFSEEYRWDNLQRLDTLWNIDKHRRLTLMTWWPDLIYWGSDGPSNRRAFPGDGTLANESVLLYIEGADEGQGDELQHEFNLVLTDDPAHSGTDDGTTEDVVRLLQHWHREIVGLTFPRIFTAMS